MLTAEDLEQRIYALSLLHRAGRIPAAEDIKLLAAIIPLVEADLVRFLTAVEAPINTTDISLGSYRPQCKVSDMLRQPARTEVAA